MSLIQGNVGAIPNFTLMFKNSQQLVLTFWDAILIFCLVISTAAYSADAPAVLRKQLGQLSGMFYQMVCTGAYLKDHARF